MYHILSDTEYLTGRAIIHRSRDLQSASVWDLWDSDEIDEPVKFQLDTRGTCQKLSQTWNWF